MSGERDEPPGGTGGTPGGLGSEKGEPPDGTGSGKATENAGKPRESRWRRIRRIVRRVWIGGGLVFTGWLVWSFQAHGLPEGTFESDARVVVDRRPESIRFRPVDEAIRARPVEQEAHAAGVVFLPGGMVDPRAYGPLARRLAEAGHPVAIVELPFRLARSEEGEAEVAGRAARAREQMGADRLWVLAGHSRGAAIATRLAHRSPETWDGLALVATTHPRVDLSGLEIPVHKIGGTRDCVASRGKAEEAAPNLPDHTVWHWIEGANHAQFGYYGRQLGDCGATIGRGEQQRRLAAVLLELLERVE